MSGFIFFKFNLNVKIITIMVIDIELTLNRWGLGKIADNKFQLLCFRFSKWQIPGKYSISFEINWKTKV